MKLAFLELRVSGPWTQMTREINTILEERGTDASAIIDIEIRRQRDSDWLLVFYREESRNSWVDVPAKEITSGMKIMVEGQERTVKECRSYSGWIEVKFFVGNLKQYDPRDLVRAFV